MTIAGPDGPGRAWLTPDQSYKLVLLVPADAASDLGGFRAIDRATLARDQKREFVFRAGAGTGQRAYEPAVDFCADVLPIFAAKCDGPTCHGSSSRAASSLILTTSEGVRVTARGRVAQGSNTAARANTPETTPSLFGANMEIIRPGDPGSSWLTYKIELGKLPAEDAATNETRTCTPPPSTGPIPPPAGTFTPLAPARIAASDGERAILDDYVLGREMPYPSAPPSATALDFQERQRIRAWIANGAEIRECGACQ